jgi:hypothetical protein
VAPHFVAGALVNEQGVVVEAAPILRYAREQAWTGRRLRAYAAQKRWEAAYIEPVELDPTYKRV